MLQLTTNATLISVVTNAAGAVKCHADWVDLVAGAITPGANNIASITTATTTTIVAAPTTGYRNVKAISVRNDHATVANTVTVQVDDGTTVTPLWKGSLAAGESVVRDDKGAWTPYTASGVPKSNAVTATAYNAATAAQGAGFAADTYVANSFVLFPALPKIGTRARIKVDVAKTAAGVAAPVLALRFGTLGTTGDTARNTLTFNAQTAAADVGYFEIEGVFRSIGAGTSAVFVCTGACFHSLAATGFNTQAVQVLQSTSAGFDSTVSGLGVGLSMNGGTSAAWTVQNVIAEVVNGI